MCSSGEGRPSDASDSDAGAAEPVRRTLGPSLQTRLVLLPFPACSVPNLFERPRLYTPGCSHILQNGGAEEVVTHNGSSG